MGVGVNPPKTPVTKGSNGIAAVTLPNVCKMPGPPAPFVPAPLPNIGKSGDKPKGYTKKVKCEGNPVAIKGASFCSMGDIASKGTGGGLVSANTHGPCKFVGPGSMDVKFEGENVQLLGDVMTNNHGSPPNDGGDSVVQVAEVPGDPLDSKCAKNAKKIDDLINGERDRTADGQPEGTKGLKHRFAEQISGSMPPDSPGWETHNGNIVQQQVALAKEIRKRDKMDPPCKDDLPAGTRSWATRPPPTADDFYGPPVGTQYQFGGKFG